MMTTSLYSNFTSHVFVVFIRRLVNVVSTLQCISHSQSIKSFSSEEDLDLSNIPTKSGGSGYSLTESFQLPWNAIRRTWDTHMHLEGLNSGRNIARNRSWRCLFSSSPTRTPETGGPEPEHESPPKSPSPQLSPSGGDPDEFRTRPTNPRPAFEHQHQRERRLDIIHQLLVNPTLYDPLRVPRFPIVLCHGLYGFDTRGPTIFPSMRMHYWSSVLRILRGVVGAEVIVTSVPGTASISSRASRLDSQLKVHTRGRGINLLAHSMGGLDCRHLITHIRPKEYVPLSLTTVCTPHRGSVFMDWCAEHIGIGKLKQKEKELEELKRVSNGRYDSDVHPSLPIHTSNCSNPQESPSSKSSPLSPFSLLLSLLNSPAYSNLTTSYLTDIFNPSTPDSPNVKYWSVASRISEKDVSVLHPLWGPKMVVDAWEEGEKARRKNQGGFDGKDAAEWGNDGLVTVQSAKWGEFLGVMEGCDHWEMRGSRGVEFGVDLPAFPAIGLGSPPPPTSPTTNSKSELARTEQPQAHAKGDGWGFGGWTKTARSRMKSEHDAAVGVAARGKNTSSSAHAILISDGKGEKEIKKEAKSNGESRRDAESALTDRLSVVFDWLIECVPAPTTILPAGSGLGGVLGPGNDKGMEEKNRDDHLDLSRKAVMYTVSGGDGMGRGSGREKVGAELRKRELDTREDLERFYVALARKMWDAGL